MIDDALIVMPAFNEAAIIGETLAELMPVAPDVLVVDDGSRDGTREAALDAGARCLRLPANLNYGGALQAGFRLALKKSDRPFIVTFDADGQHDPRYINGLLAPLREGRADYVVGSRYLDGGHGSPAAARDLGIRLFARATSSLTGLAVTDPTSGLTAMTREVARVFLSELYPQDYPDADVIVMLERMGFRLAEVPAAARPSRSGQSMHGGLLRPLYYIYKMSLSLLIVATRGDLEEKRKEAGLAA